MTATDLDRAVADGLANLLVVIGDNKYFLGRWLSQWAVGAPGLESAVAAAAISQGHLGQARTLFPFVDRLTAEDTHIGTPDGGRPNRYNLVALDEPFGTWAEAVATLYLVDPALDVVLRALQGADEDLKRRVDRVLQESRFHADFARGRLVELTNEWDAGRSQLEPALASVLPEILCWFGPDGESGVEALRGAGALSLDNQGMRGRYLDVVGPPLVELGYAGGLGLTGERRSWTIEELPWDRWNRLRRRLETS